MRRADKDEEGELTTVGTNYDFLSDGLLSGIGHEDEIKALVLKDFKTGDVMGSSRRQKGPTGQMGS